MPFKPNPNGPASHGPRFSSGGPLRSANWATPHARVSTPSSVTAPSVLRVTAFGGGLCYVLQLLVGLCYVLQLLAGAVLRVTALAGAVLRGYGPLNSLKGTLK